MWFVSVLWEVWCGFREVLRWFGVVCGGLRWFGVVCGNSMVHDVLIFSTVFEHLSFEYLNCDIYQKGVC